ncbi:MAG: hypothetical protein ACODAE_09060, partial [Gemmatimonadota bacterium]
VSIVLEIEGEYDIPADSRVVLESGGLLGGTVAQVTPGDGPPAEAGDVLDGTRTDGPLDMMTRLGDRAEGVMGRVDTLLERPTLDALRASAIELRSVLGSMSALIDQETRDLAAIGESLRRSTASIERATSGRELDRTVAQLDSASARAARVAATLERTTSSLDVILARIERGEGTLGRLSVDDELYVNLNEAAATATALLEDVQANPGRYIRLEIF